MAGQSWSLKIFSGAHIGAETDLEQGSYILGSHEDCDFVLTDDFIAEQHAEITISESGVTVKSLCGQAISLDAQPAGESCTVEKHQMITIAELNFAFGFPGEPWPALTAVMPGTASGNTGQSPASEEQSTGGNAEQASTETASSVETKQEIASDQTTVSTESSDSKNVEENKNDGEKGTRFSLLKLFKPTFLIRLHAYVRRYYLWSLFGLAFAGFLFAFSFSFYWLWEKTAPDEMHQPVNYIEVTENIRRQMNLSDINIRQLADGSVAIGGYIVDNEKKNQLLQALDQQGVPIKLQQLFVMSDIRMEAVQALKAAGYRDMQIEADTTPGSLILIGYAPGPKYVAAIREVLNSEVPGLLALVEQVEFQSTRQKALHTMLQEYGLSPQIKLLEQDNKITLKGRLENVSEGYYFKKVVNNFREKYGNNPELVIDVTIPSVSMETLKPKLKIKSISLGHIPYIILDDGQKYLTGARLDNGYILESIKLDYLVLRLGKQLIKYQVSNNNE